jgi:mono/diheme cytochrome c family protein
VRNLALLVVVASLAGAQAKRTVWDGVYTAEQAARGEAAFSRSCANCHVLATEGKAPLVGDHFWKSFSQKSVGELLEFVTNYMPNGAPKSLDEATYSSIVAAMLKSNGFPAGAAELDRSTVAEIVPRDGSMALPANALVRVVGCLTKSGQDWVVTRATSPVRAERAAQPSEDATRPLGTRTMPLKFVLTKLDALAGSRVVVNGLLMGTDGVDGLNVTTVNRVAAQCP